MSPTKSSYNKSNKRYPKSIKSRIFGYINLKKSKPKSKNKKEKHQEEPEIITAKWTKRLAIFTIGLFVVGIFTAGIFYLQLWEMQKDHREDQRAWMSINNIKPVLKNHDPVFFQVDIENTGKTPALQITGWIGISESLVLAENSFDNPTAPTTPINYLRHNSLDYGLQAPGDACCIVTPGIITKEAIKRMRSGGSFYIYGMIVYRDIYGVHHWTEFCQGLEPTSNFNNFGAVGKHNQTDDVKNENKSNYLDFIHTLFPFLNRA